MYLLKKLLCSVIGLFAALGLSAAWAQVSPNTATQPTAPQPTAAETKLIASTQAAYERGQLRSAEAGFTTLARAGNAWAMYNLSAMHVQAQTRERKPQLRAKLAYQWLQASAEKQYPQAQYLLGKAYESGQFQDKNLTLAVKNYALAAEQNHAEAMIEYATALYLGRGVGQDIAAAGQWYLSAARAGDRDAQTVAARMFETGEGLAQDDRLARYWYSVAAKAGDVPSQAKMFRYESADTATKLMLENTQGVK